MNTLFPSAPFRRVGSLACLLVGLCVFPSASSALAQGSQRLKSGDSFEIVVYEEPTLSRVHTVNPAGEINYPLLGKQRVAGKTPDEIAMSIEKLLEKDYIKDAQVTASITARPDHSVLIIGEVKRPGRVSFPANTGLDLFTAISTAGGVTANTDASKIEIRSKGGVVRSAALEKSRRLALSDGDNVVVPAMPTKSLMRITVLGEVKKPGTIKIAPGEKIDLLTAIAMSGGFSDKAKESKTQVRRNGKTQTLNCKRMRKGLDPPLYLRDGDTVYAEESFF